MTISVSVVVPTYKRPELLRRCLDALMVQDFDPSAYEIIVVDDAACPETERLVRNWTTPANGNGTYSEPINGLSYQLPGLAYELDASLAEAESAAIEQVHNGNGLFFLWNVPAARQLSEETLELASPRWIQPPQMIVAPATPRLRYLAVQGNHGPAAARNCGWQAAEGVIIAFTDDDCLPQPGWLKAGLAAFTAEVIGVSGRVRVPLPPVPTDYERDTAGLEIGEFVTANCFYRRAVLAAVGGFDERFRIAWREDSDLLFALLKRFSGTDWRLVRAPEAVVIHPVRPALWGISLRQQRKSMFNALLYKKHPRLYRQRLQPQPPWRYYLSLAAFLTALLAAILGAGEPALGAAGVWVLLTGVFCGQRLRGATRTPAHIAEMMLTSALIPPLSIFWRIRGAFKFKVFFL